MIKTRIKELENLEENKKAMNLFITKSFIDHKKLIIKKIEVLEQELKQLKELEQ